MLRKRETRRPAGVRVAGKARPRLRRLLGIPLLFGVVAGLVYGALTVASAVSSAAGELAQTVGLSGSESGPVWRGTERINILLLGLDRRPDESDQLTRSDTMMVLTFDPTTRSTGLLSIPRDLWVQIPISDKKTVEDRINAAYVFGQTQGVPGGGVTLAKKTIQHNLGIKVNYAASIDLAGFVKVIDFLGGVTLDVETPLKDNEFPTADYGTMRIYFPPGLQHFDGERTLQYARSRHQDSDVSRASRQQKVLLAIRDRALQLDLLSKLPRFITDFRDVVKTDLSPTDILALARYARDVDPKGVQLRTVPSTPTVTTTGAEVLTLDRRAFAKVQGDLFGGAAAVKQEPAPVEVLNGTTTTGLASRTAALLAAKGLNVVRFASADESDRRETTIYAGASSRQTAEQVATILGLPVDRIRDRTGDSSSEVRVVLGRDAKVP